MPPAFAPSSAAAGSLPPALCVVGLGLIGGSLARAAQPLLPVFGWTPSEITQQAAAADGHDVEADLAAALARAVREDALVVLASPVTTFRGLLLTIDELAPTVRLTDVAGVKALVQDEVADLAPTARYIGSHPMCGSAASGWRAGSAALFQDAAWVTCLTDDSDLDDWAAVAGLALAVGSRVVPAEPQAHDLAVARISHLPHLMALALAQVGEHGGALALALAAGSFADGTRVAGTRPKLIRAMTETNREALIDAADDALGILGVARGSLASTGSLLKIAEAGHAARIRFEQRADQLRAVTLDGDDLLDQLLAVGSAGGHVSGIERTTDGLTISAWYPDEE
ncbi:MAG: prephenate dehydrogenase [Nakamurella sp.]